MEQTEKSLDMTHKILATLRSHVNNEDLESAFICIRELVKGTKESNKRPMVRLLAAKSIMEFSKDLAKLEVMKDAKPDMQTVNIYQTKGTGESDIVSLARGLNNRISQPIKG